MSARAARKPVTASDLPFHDGVGASVAAIPAGASGLAADLLAQRFPMIAKDVWQARMAQGRVFDQYGEPLAPDAGIAGQGKIFYYREVENEAAIPFAASIVFQDELLVVADKPHFLPVTPSGIYLQHTLLVRLRRELGIDTLAPIHRIDRDTAGLVLFSVQPTTRDRYQALFRRQEVAKTYEAIAPWRADLVFPLTFTSRLAESPAFMQMQAIDGVPNARTRIELLEVCGPFARYRLSPSTGQKHQLRAHMAALGIPIVNDRIYPVLMPAPTAGATPAFDKPLQLLAQAIGFSDPVTGLARRFTSVRTLLPLR